MIKLMPGLLIVVFQMLAGPALAQETLTASYAAALNEMTIHPADVLEPTWPPVHAACGAEELSKILAALRSGVYDGRAGSYVFARQFAACKLTNANATTTLASAFERYAQADGLSLTLIALVADRINIDDFKTLGKEQIAAALKQTGPRYNFWIASYGLEWAAGACYTEFSVACLARAVKDLFPDGSQMDNLANLAVGDLIGLPIPDLPREQIAALLRSLVDNGMPVRRDISRLAAQPNKMRLSDRRRIFLESRFGLSEEL